MHKDPGRKDDTRKSLPQEEETFFFLYNEEEPKVAVVALGCTKIRAEKDDTRKVMEMKYMYKMEIESFTYILTGLPQDRGTFFFLYNDEEPKVAVVALGCTKIRAEKDDTRKVMEMKNMYKMEIEGLPQEEETFFFFMYNDEEPKLPWLHLDALRSGRKDDTRKIYLYSVNIIFTYNDDESEKVIASDAQECTKSRAEKMVREKAHEINLINKIDTERY
ncbi:unnamed protein product [Mytilus edulis]|uniref:Uncharacterized protein n=1 Tax=Mytilus edulis TaxID=6550 RepID=A0A8S3SDI2_MYTED|nr:unnamed protein product [Mytilus edulis]